MGKIGAVNFIYPHFFCRDGKIARTARNIQQYRFGLYTCKLQCFKTPVIIHSEAEQMIKEIVSECYRVEYLFYLFFLVRHNILYK